MVAVRNPSPRRSFRALAACGVAFGAALVGLAACILADPPAELPKLPVVRPTIVHGSVTPSAAHVLGRVPDQFVVPVELVDPSVAFEWRVFVDFDPLVQSQPVFAQTSVSSASDPDLTTRLIPFGNPIAAATDPTFDTCHVIEFLVAYSFPGTSNHTPDSRGGDSIVWLYDSSGDLGGCTRYDAGAFADASTPERDAGDASQGGAD